MLLLAMILAHLIADFYLQTDKMVKDKMKYIGKHMGHHLIVLGMVILGFWVYYYEFKDFVKYLFLPLSFILLTHCIIDITKIKLLDTIKHEGDEHLKKLCFFLLDQFLHLAMMILACHIFFDIEFARIIDRVVELLVDEGENRQLNIINKLLFAVIILISVTTVSGHMIRILLGSLPSQLLTFEGKYAYKNEVNESLWMNKQPGKTGLTEELNFMVFNKHDLSRGKLIGYIERLLVILLTYYSAYPAIAFIVTAKSIARFKQMDDRDWAEYFLLGTLTSMFLAIAFGIILRETIN
ncbi:DUF3307 domain-containing protein [Bacillus sp. T33-2]|uniref:DUF3307 domain-containing protein n=1 Tax=Bacillus sp. T33-2 TaxID=2054168 RepID=UPI000C781CD1|nr:DUF3307 domain-containing protein [Bacillus sp. T33-2]PLR91136.1 DUF3307 domain-containing protein [Bacillus sp. T33-2]